ncbi:MAG TPA: DNRLRE domain-containing protein [Tepidisphaeraceae bacterium]|jgi:hypothetical protein|nr:DNRLRE domain-containing protein [Tepidisphaeraceae bacterium]
MQRSAFLGFVVALSVATAVTRADVATIGAAKDNTIFQSNVNNSLGAGQAIFAGTNAQSSPRRGLIQFDIAGSVPAGSRIDSVQLTLFLNQVGSAATTSPTIRLYRLASDWGEGAAGSSSNGVSGIGQGFAAGEGDATWNARHFSATTPTLWSTAGGDFAATDSASLAIVGTTLNTPYTWGSTSALVADVQSWLNNASSNFGWILKSDEEVGASTVRGFWTREAARTGQSAFVPQLQVSYTAVPEPYGMILVLAGSILGVWRRGR